MATLEISQSYAAAKKNTFQPELLIRFALLE